MIRIEDDGHDGLLWLITGADEPSQTGDFRKATDGKSKIEREIDERVAVLYGL